MAPRVFNDGDPDAQQIYRLVSPFDPTIKRPEIPRTTNDWNEVLRYGAEWGPELERERERVWKEMKASGIEGDERLLLEPDVSIVTLSLKNRRLRLNDPKSWLSDYDIRENVSDEGWTLYRTYDLQPGFSSYMRHRVEMAAGRLVLTGKGKFLFLQDSGFANTDDHSRWANLLLDPVNVAKYKPRATNDYLDRGTLKEYHYSRLETQESLRQRLEKSERAGGRFAQMEYDDAVITPEKAGKGGIRGLTPRIAVAGLCRFLSQHNMIPPR